MDTLKRLYIIEKIRRISTVCFDVSIEQFAAEKYQ